MAMYYVWAVIDDHKPNSLVFSWTVWWTFMTFGDVRKSLTGETLVLRVATYAAGTMVLTLIFLLTCRNVKLAETAGTSSLGHY